MSKEGGGPIFWSTVGLPFWGVWAVFGAKKVRKMGRNRRKDRSDGKVEKVHLDPQNTGPDGLGRVHGTKDLRIWRIKNGRQEG